jgi:hypothetical protein
MIERIPSSDQFARGSCRERIIAEFISLLTWYIRRSSVGQQNTLASKLELSAVCCLVVGPGIAE